MAKSSVKQRLNDRITTHMKTDLALLRPEQTVDQALAAIREKASENRIIYFYVVDEEKKLLGVVPTRRLLLSQPGTVISSIMVKNAISIPEHATVLDACEFFMLHRLLAFPIVDARKHVLGVVDVDLYTDELHDMDVQEDSEQLFQLIGVHLSQKQQSSPLLAFKHRFPWLLTNIAGGVLAAFLTGMFEAELEKAVSLALFIPVVLALAESVSIQSVSIAIQSSRSKTITLKEIFGKLRVELMTGFMLGLACATVVALVALIWLGQGKLVTCLLGGIIGGVTCAALIGVLVPNLIRFFKREPHVAAGPVALAFADMVTLLIYFSLARALFGGGH